MQGSSSRIGCHFSSSIHEEEVEGGPTGELLQHPASLSLLHKSSSIRRTFGPRSNAQAMLTCGGPSLAKHASFDPSYDRAREWIRRHPVGHAVLSGPVLIGGLIGTLVEASVPQAVYLSSSLRQLRPLIVGVEIEASITVTSIQPTTANNKTSSSSSPSEELRGGNKGYDVQLATKVSRVRDDVVIAEGTHDIWIPDYMHM